MDRVRMRTLWQNATNYHGLWLPTTACLFAFLMPLWQNVLPVVLVAFMVSWWAGAEKRPALRWNSPLPWTGMLFLLHVVGMAWSTNWDYGLFDLQIKVPLLLLPVLGMLRPRGVEILLPLVFLAFASGNVLAVLIGLGHVGFTVAAGNVDLSQVFFGASFAILTHSSYFSMMLSLALGGFFLLHVHQVLPGWIRVLIPALLCVGIVLCGSKIGWIVFPLVLAWVLIRQWRERETRMPILGLGVATIGGIALLLTLSPFARDRVEEMIASIRENDVRPEATTSSEIRKLAWRGAWEVSARHFPWGAGTGDVKDKLIEVYEERGYQHLVERRINAHSQFLQMFAALGVAGLLLTAFIILIPLTRRSAGPVMRLLLLLALLNWAVESMLEVQAGVMLFAFFSLLLSRNIDLRSRDPLQPPAHR